jgi:hypothetical protein
MLVIRSLMREGSKAVLEGLGEGHRVVLGTRVHDTRGRVGALVGGTYCCGCGASRSACDVVSSS